MNDDRASLTKIVASASVVCVALVAVAVLLQSCGAHADETNVVSSPAALMLSISTDESAPGSIRIVTAIGTNAASRIIQIQSFSIALDEGLVLRQLAKDLWQVTTAEKAARSTIVGGTP